MFISYLAEKLYDIITRCCKDLKLNYGNYIVLRRYTTSKNRKKIETVQFLSHYLKRAINKKAIMNKKKPKLVEIGKLLAKINKLIFEQKVEQRY